MTSPSFGSLEGERAISAIVGTTTLSGTGENDVKDDIKAIREFKSQEVQALQFILYAISAGIAVKFAKSPNVWAVIVTGAVAWVLLIWFRNTLRALGRASGDYMGVPVSTASNIIDLVSVGVIVFVGTLFTSAIGVGDAGQSALVIVFACAVSFFIVLDCITQERQRTLEEKERAASERTRPLEPGLFPLPRAIA
jgi:hypothetical protein